MICIKNLTKSYHNSQNISVILDDSNLEVNKGEWCSIVGPSGTGKSTLLNCLSGIQSPTSGEILINNKSIFSLNEEERSNFRRLNIGFVFQDFKLLPHYTVLDNVMLPLTYDIPATVLRNRAIDLLNEVGIHKNLFQRLPESLSGGEKQRVAIARSLIADPSILLCDEPTGNLDAENRNKIISILLNVKNNGKTVVVVTHDNQVAAVGDMTYELKEKKLKELLVSS
ncbi:ABC transporter ATP-binding protein [Gottfriedia sp. NPDC056225]|uniref:ABC transporter ATP-binding protein n=1 Tax=Gottfriedia sp. NPDC056225 TaxID=3345751 RepID=UPI0035E14AA3